MIGTHERMASTAAATSVSRVDRVRLAEVTAPSYLPMHQLHANVLAIAAINAPWAIDAAAGGEGTTTLVTGAECLPATATSTGTSKSKFRRRRRPRIPST